MIICRFFRTRQKGYFSSRLFSKRYLQTIHDMITLQLKLQHFSIQGKTKYRRSEVNDVEMLLPCKWAVCEWRRQYPKSSTKELYRWVWWMNCHRVAITVDASHVNCISDISTPQGLSSAIPLLSCLNAGSFNTIILHYTNSTFQSQSSNNASQVAARRASSPSLSSSSLAVAGLPLVPPKGPTSRRQARQAIFRPLTAITRHSLLVEERLNALEYDDEECISPSTIDIIVRQLFRHQRIELFSVPIKFDEIL